MLDYKLLEKFRIDISFRDITSAHEGNMAIRSRGNSLEFSEYSAYEPRDDTRRIDWNIFARTKKLYIKHYEAEKKIKANIFLDNSASMCAGDLNKLQKSLAIAKGLAYIAFNQGYEVYWNNSILNKGFDKRCLKNKSEIMKIDMTQNDLILDDFLSKLQKSNVRSGELVIIVSDCYTPNIEQIIKYFRYKKCKLILVHTLGKREQEVLWSGNLKMKDSETREEIRVEMNRHTRKLYAQKLKEHLNLVEGHIRKYGYKFSKPNLEKDIEYIFFEEFIREKILR